MNLPKTSFSFILYFVRQQWLRFFILSLSFIVWAVKDTVYPYFLKRIINTVSLYHGDRAGIFVAVAGTVSLLIFFWLLAEFVMRMQGILQIYTFPIFRANVRESVMEYVKSHSHEYFSSQFSGNLAKKLSDLPTSCQTVVEIVGFQFVTAGSGALIVLVMMWLTKPIFALILFFWLCVHLTITILFMKRGNTLWEDHSDSVSELSGKIVDVLTNMLNVRLFARRQYEASYINKFQKQEIVKARKAMWLIEIMRIGLGLNGLLLIVGVLFSLLYGWVHHWVTLGDFTQVSMQSFWLLGWIWFVSFQITVFAREVGTINDALSLVKKGHDLVDRPDASSILIERGEIIFDKVNFSYQKQRPVFQDLQVVIPGGQKVGLVGFSGSGKSTFVNLILRFYDVDSGRILIDGTDIATITQESLRSQIAMIPQDPALFHRSLMENIRYGRLEASDAEVIAASKLAHCHEFIEKLPEGYESMVGERGIKLSGGQRQRIAIARAVLKNAPILILDEATSSLDSVTERLIQDSLHALMQKRTTIVVAHRLSTLADMDTILVFDKGRVVESGSKESLLAMNGHFASLWNMQTNGFLPD